MHQTRLAAATVAITICGWLGCGSSDPPTISAKGSLKYEVDEADAPATEAGTAEAPGTAGSSASAMTPADSSSAVDDRQAAPSRPRVSDIPGEASAAAGAAPATGGGRATAPRSAATGATAGKATTGADPDAAAIERLRELAATPPSGNTREEVTASFQTLQGEIVALAEELLQSATKPETAEAAANAKVKALSQLAALGVSSARQELQTFGGELAKHAMPKLQQLGRRLALQSSLEAVANGALVDTKGVVADFLTMVQAEEKGEQLVTFVNQVAMLFEQQGLHEDTIAVLNGAAAEFEKANAEQHRAAVQLFRQQAELISLDVSGKLRAVLEQKPNAADELVAALEKLITPEKAGPMVVEVTQQVVQIAEQIDLPLANRIFDLLDNAFREHQDASLREDVIRMVASFRKRTGIVGKPFALAGTLHDGQPLDWNAYRGKVVLVDFWATWCGPCLQSLPGLRKTHAEYRDRGFEVVGVSLDRSVAELSEFMALQKLPWSSVVGVPGPDGQLTHPLADQYGVEAIPFTVLIDREGNGLAVNLSDEELRAQLDKLCGAPAAAPAGDKPSTPNAAPANKAPATTDAAPANKESEKKTETKQEAPPPAN